MLSNHEVVSIRRRLNAGDSLRKVAADYKVSPSTIQKIGYGLLYKDAGGPIAEPGSRAKHRSQKESRNPRAKLSVEHAIEARHLRRAGNSVSGIAERLGVSVRTISKLLHNESWTRYIIKRKDEFPDQELFSYDFNKRRPPKGSSEEKALVDRAFTAYRKFGYPFRERPSAKTLSKINSRVSSSARPVEQKKVSGSHSGLGALNSYHPHMEFVSCRGRMSPYEVFQGDDSFREALYVQVRYGRRLTPAGVRSALTETGKGSQISAFRPTVAASLVSEFNAKTVLDPCAGWGGRALGATAVGASYVGIDPSDATINGNRAFFDALCRADTTIAAPTFHHGRAEDVLPTIAADSFDVVLTSPPYFDLEHYASDPTQSFIRYPTLEDWRNGFLVPLLVGSRRAIKPDGKILLNVSSDIAGAIEELAALSGLVVEDRLSLVCPSRRWSREERPVRGEPILVLARGGGG